MTNPTNPRGIEEAKGKIMYALIGFGIVFAAFWIVQIAGVILGINQASSIFGP